jgi:TRAP transporter TAXI family solute receptor
MLRFLLSHAQSERSPRPGGGARRGCGRTILTILSLFVISLCALPARAQEPVLRLATGPTGSGYEAIGGALRGAAEASPARVHITLLPASDARTRLELLTRGEADLILIQNDVAGAEAGRLTAARKQLPWRTVLVLAQEPVQIVAGPLLRGDGFDQLSSRPLAIGSPDSDNAFTASELLRTLRLPRGDTVAPDGDDQAEALRRHHAQAAIFVVSAPNPQVASLLADPDYRLLSLNTNEMNALHDASPYYTSTTIFENTYPNQAHSVSTVSVLTVLVCRADLPDDLVRQLATALLESAVSAESPLRLQQGFNLADTLQLNDRAALPLHPGSAAALGSLPLALRVRAYLHWVQWGLLVGLAGLLLVVASLRRPRLSVIRRFGKHLPTQLARLLRYLLFHRLIWQIVRTAALFMLVWLIGSAVMYLCEREVNINFSGLRVSSLSILVYLFSGLEDRAPVTTGGWIGSVVMLVCNVLIAAYITGQFASEIMRHTFGVIQMTKNSAKGSMLIVGWNPRAERVVREIFAAFEVALPEHSVTVLNSERVDTVRFAEFETRGVTFVSGDAFDKKLLARIGAHQARSVIVMAKDDCEDPDALTTLTVLALRSVCRDEGDGARPRICAEVLNHRKMSLILDAGADEVVCHEDFGLGVLAQSAFATKLTHVYQELLSYSVTSCEIYILSSTRADTDGSIPVDVWQGLFEGKTFVEASEVFNLNRDGENPPILIGIQRGERVLLNPRGPLQLQIGDSLIVIAYVLPRMENLRRIIPRQI